MSTASRTYDLQSLMAHLRQQGRAAAGSVVQKLYELEPVFRQQGGDLLARRGREAAEVLWGLAATGGRYDTQAAAVLTHLDALVACVAGRVEAGRQGADPAAVPVPPVLVLPEADDEQHFAETVGMFIAHAIGALSELEEDLLAVDASTNPAETIADVRRTVHRLKAEFGVLNMSAPQQLCHQAETTIDACVEQGAAFPVDEMLHGIALLKQFLERRTRDAEAQFGDVEPVLQKLREAAEAAQAASATAAGRAPLVELRVGGDFVDRLPEFMTEARSHLAQAEAAMVAIASSPESHDHIHRTFRSFHTIKGVAGFLNLGPLVELAHAAETLLDRARSQQLRLRAADGELVLAAGDMVQQLLGILEGRPAPERRQLARLVAQLQAAAARVASTHLTTTLPTAGPTQTANRFVAGKFLCFRLSKEEYGIAILRVREIIGTDDVTPLPRTADFVFGVTKLRGHIIPVIDLRRRFGLEPIAPTAESCIIVVDVGRDAESTFRVGCLVDAVSEVLSIGTEQFEVAPRCANAAGDCIAGLAKLKDRVLILLDIERVVAEIDPAALATGNPEMES
jgi:purine-binding chemotaxis protein CheW